MPANNRWYLIWGLKDYLQELYRDARSTELKFCQGKPSACHFGQANHTFNSPGLKQKLTISFLCLIRHLIIRTYGGIIQLQFNAMLTSRPECSGGELEALRNAPVVGKEDEANKRNRCL